MLGPCRFRKEIGFVKFQDDDPITCKQGGPCCAKQNRHGHSCFTRARPPFPDARNIVFNNVGTNVCDPPTSFCMAQRRTSLPSFLSIPNKDTPPQKNKPGGGDSCYPNKTPHSVYVLGTSPAFPKPGKSPNALSPCLTQTRARQPTGRRGSGSARTCLCSGQTTTLLQNSCSSSVGSDFTKYSFS